MFKSIIKWELCRLLCIAWRMIVNGLLKTETRQLHFLHAWFSSKMWKSAACLIDDDDVSCWISTKQLLERTVKARWMLCNDRFTNSGYKTNDRVCRVRILQGKRFVIASDWLMNFCSVTSSVLRIPRVEVAVRKNIFWFIRYYLHI